jgi:hypothetical protein
MFKLRDVIIFIAGAEFFHTISHIILPFFISLPLHTNIIEVTPTVNLVAILINTIITLLLLWWAKKLSR